jgi:hypothetical protein
VPLEAPLMRLVRLVFFFEIRFIKFNSTFRAYQTKSSPLEGLVRLMRL